MLVFQVFLGRPFHLRLSLHQLLRHYSADQIVLIGDETNVDLGPWRHQIAQFETPTLERLRKCYVHMSSNPDWFELLCIERWFLILDYVQSVGYDGPIFHLDSDTLLHGTVHFDNSLLPDFACLRRTGPQYAIFKNSSILAEFVDFLLAQYEDPEKLAVLKAYYATKESPLEPHGGNVCDMHLMGLFTLEIGPRYRDINELGLEGMLEMQIGVYEDCKVDRSLCLKKVIVDPESRRPFVLQRGKKVPLSGQHFVGWAKALMPRYYTGEAPLELSPDEERKIADTLQERRRYASSERVKDLGRPLKHWLERVLS